MHATEPATVTACSYACRNTEVHRKTPCTAAPPLQVAFSQLQLGHSVLGYQGPQAKLNTLTAWSHWEASRRQELLCHCAEIKLLIMLSERAVPLEQ